MTTKTPFLTIKECSMCSTKIVVVWTNLAVAWNKAQQNWFLPVCGSSKITVEKRSLGVLLACNIFNKNTGRTLSKTMATSLNHGWAKKKRSARLCSIIELCLNYSNLCWTHGTIFNRKKRGSGDRLTLTFFFRRSMIKGLNHCEIKICNRLSL